MCVQGKKANFANVINLERHIEILLLSNECVIIPDFGGFMAYHICSRYNEEEGVFLPPLRNLGFNPQLKINDSLLVQSYIEAYDISYPEALQRIKDEVVELKEEISNCGRYEFRNLGTIFVNEEVKYEFQPCEAGVLTPSLYGLSLLEASPLAKVVDEQIGNRTPAKAKVVRLDTSHATAKEGNGRTAILQGNFMRNFAAACIALFAVLLIPSNNFDKPNHLISSPHFNMSLLYKIMPKDVVLEKKATTLNANGKDALVGSAASTAKPSTGTSTIQEEPNQQYFCLVLASWVPQKNATEFISQLKQEGFESARMLHRAKGIKVVYGQYKDENDAYTALRSLRNNKHFKEAWVMEVK